MRHFDLICGTGTGGLIAIMLARLRMSTGDAINLDLATAVYREKPPLRHGLSQVGRGAYDHEVLVRKVRDFIHKYTRDDAVTTLADPRGERSI